jgi:flagellar P-ring protein precursor FlgI
MVGVIVNGCKMEADVRTQFHLNGKITLVIDKNHANFQTVDSIRQILEDRFQNSLNPNSEASGSAEVSYVKAVDASNIEVRIPELYIDDPVGFATDLLEQTVFDPEPEARVVVNPRAGTIVISGNVEIGDVIVSHKNVVVEAGTSSGFTAIDPDKSGVPRLDELVNQLNALKVPTDDMIEIIRVIDRSGKLHGRLIMDPN